MSSFRSFVLLKYVVLFILKKLVYIFFIVSLSGMTGENTALFIPGSK